MLTRLFLASVRANAGRTTLSVAGIALGVALGLAVHLINQSAISEMQQASRTLSGDADLSIRGGRDRRTIRFIGIDVFRAARLQPGFAAELNAGEDRLAALRPGNVFLNRAARELLARLPLNAAPGSLPVASGAGHALLHIAGNVDLPQYREPLAVMDIAGAQTTFNQTGRLSRIDIRLQPGIAPDTFRETLSAQLPPGLAISTPAQTDRQSAAVSRAYRINLTVLSLVALFTGGVLVLFTPGLSVGPRRPHVALFRTLGLTPVELLRALLAESAALGATRGIVGAALGLALPPPMLGKLGGG